MNDLHHHHPVRRAGGATTTRERIVATARRVFAERGYDGASIREITAGAEVNLGAVTYHFGSKHALYEAVLEDAFQPLVERMAAAPAPAPDESMLDGIERVARWLFEHLDANPDLQFLVLQQLTTQQEIPAPAARVFAGLYRLLAERIAAGQARGEVREGDPVLMAISVASQPAYFALVARYLLHRLALSGRAPAWERIVDHGVGFLRAGLAATEADT
ncbi:MAG: TetR/AcrR family transcriptional regulator [Longimicrobiales bacterium]